MNLEDSSTSEEEFPSDDDLPSEEWVREYFLRRDQDVAARSASATRTEQATQAVAIPHSVGVLMAQAIAAHQSSLDLQAVCLNCGHNHDTSFCVGLQPGHSGRAHFADDYQVRGSPSSVTADISNLDRAVRALDSRIGHNVINPPAVQTSTTSGAGGMLFLSVQEHFHWAWLRSLARPDSVGHSSLPELTTDSSSSDEDLD